MLIFSCTQATFHPVPTGHVRWLDETLDEGLVIQFWQALGQDLASSTWRAAHGYGYQYAAILKNDRLVSLAGVWRFSEDCWEVAAVVTLQEQRRKGYSQSVVAFVTSYILASGRLATCSTHETNTAMIATLRKVGFQQVPPAEVWWSYPRLPDF